MGNRNISSTKILTDSASFQLVRTNPRLTGNVKVMVSESDEMWLESIKANPELSKDLYSKVGIDITHSHASNIFRFFNNGTTPNEVIFDLSEQVDSTKTSKDFKDQYDFSHYFSGAKYLVSNKYSERISYFAPLYLKKDLPTYFIILKISDPANFPLDQVKKLYDESQSKTDYLIDLFSKASIIKTFDLRPETRVGKYIRDYVNDKNFPASPLTVGFGENDYTTWNGVLVNEGKLGNRGELLESLYASSQPLKYFEENITNGYSRNGILFPDILNLEFIFNDDSSEKYDFNRYLGFYVNAVELSKLDIDLDRSYSTRSTWENIPNLRKPYLESDDVIIQQANPNGVIVPYKNLDINMSEFNNIFTDSDSLFLNYISDKDGKLYIPNLNPTLETIYESSHDATMLCVGSIVTVTSTSHGYFTSELITIDSSDSNYTGEFPITRINANSFTYTLSATPANLTAVGQVKKKIADATAKTFNIDYTTPNPVLLSTTTTIVSATQASHGYLTDDLIVITSLDSDYSGEFLITKIDDNTFEYSVQSIPTNPTASGSSKKELRTGYIRFANTKLDLGLFFGQSRNTFLQDAGAATKIQGHSHSVITINSNFNNYDEIRVYHPHGTRVDSIGKHDLIQSVQSLPIYALIPNPGEYYVYNDYDNILGYDEFYMNGSGYLSQVASALANCINGIRNRSFTAYAYDDQVFIKLNIPGDFDISHKLSFASPTSQYSVVSIYGISNNDLINTQINFKGGSKEVGNRLIIDAGHLDKLNNNFESILIKSSDSYSKIRKISQYIDNINEENSLTAASRTKAVNLYNNKIAVVLNENELPTISHNEFLMRPKFRPTMGLLSFFSIKDLDFDFYSSTYTNFPEIDLYKYYFIPENTKLLEPGIEYISYSGSVSITDSLNPTGITYLENIPFTVSSLTSYSIVSGSPLVTFNPAVSPNPIIPILDENKELKDFSGFSLLKDPSKILSQDTTNEYILRTKYLNGVTPTEYDYYKENESLDFARRSKIIPYITKWGIKNGTDSRSNPYRLNTEIIFGRNNFSPDHIDNSQNPTNFTHEWFYIESNFNYMNDDSLIAKNNYYFETSFDYKGELLTNPNYFVDYFTYTPTNLDGVEVGDTQIRYSSLIKNSAGQYEAFFKGFKLTFKDVTDPTVLGPDGKAVARTNSNRFDGYKFSCILKPVEEKIHVKDQAPIKYNVIEHTDYKFIVIVIELSLGQISNIDPYWRDLTAANNFGGISSNLLNTTNFNSKTIVPPDSLTGSPVNLVETINGDYRIDFNTTYSTPLAPVFFRSVGNVIEASTTPFVVPPLPPLTPIPHGYSTGDIIVIDTADPAYSGEFIITVTGVGTFEYTVLTAPITISITGLSKKKLTDGVSNLTHTLLYSLKNKKYNNYLNAFSNIRMASKLNIRSGVDPAQHTIQRLNNSFTPNYPAVLSDDLSKLNDSTVIFIRDITSGLNIFIDSKALGIANGPGTGIGRLFNIFDKSFDNYIHYDTTEYNLCLVLPTYPNVTLYGSIPGSLLSIINNYFVFKVLSGGEQYFEKLFQKISFSRFKKYVNEQTPATEHPIIEYSSYSLVNGISTLNSDPKFYLEIPDISNITKNNQLITNYTTKIPTQFSGQADIGTDYEVANLPLKYEVNRYKGEYEPVTQNRSIYQSNFTFKNNRINDISLSNIKFNSLIDSMMTLSNFNHIKISDSQILELESDDTYLPVYPKIDEVAIGQGDYFLLKGNWDWGFHYKYSTKSKKELVSGALRVEEDNSFLAKLINVPEYIELDYFDKTDTSQFYVIGETEDLDKVDISNRELVIKETPTSLTGILNLNNTLTRFLIADGIGAKFTEYLSNNLIDTSYTYDKYIGNFNNITDYIKQYIKLNILKVYDIDTNEFYAKSNASISATNTQSTSNPNGIEFDFLTDRERFVQGYTILKSLQINKKDRLILRFKLDKTPGSGLSISPIIKIKFI